MQNQCCLLTNIDPTTVPKPFVKLWATCGRRRTTCRPGSPRHRFDARRFHTGSIHYAITALWTASHYGIPMTIVVASNAEYLVTFSNPDSSSVTSPENATRQLAEVPYAVPPPIRPGHSWVLGVEAVDVEVFHSVLIPDLIFAVQVVECPTLAWGHEQ